MENHIFGICGVDIDIAFALRVILLRSEYFAVDSLYSVGKSFA